MRKKQPKLGRFPLMLAISRSSSDHHGFGSLSHSGSRYEHIKHRYKGDSVTDAQVIAGGISTTFLPVNTRV